MHRCPVCYNKNVIGKGALPTFHEQVFGGVAVHGKFEAGQFLWCPECDLHFRYPYLEQQVLTNLYRKLPASTWEYQGVRAVWRDVQRLLKVYSANNKILDVGCFRGDFLAFLSDDWQKYGVEPNITAREIAAERNIELVGNTIEDIQATVKSVGAIVILDVLEHIYEPLLALQKLQCLLAPGGCIIIFTGATDTLAWRFFGRHYWYCALPEHVTFFSLKWFQWAAGKLKMKVVWHRYFSSEPSGKKSWLAQFSKLFLYTIVQQLRNLSVPEWIFSSFPLIKKSACWKNVPWWQAAKDHILVVLSL